MNRLVIGIVGHDGAGKSTLASAIVAQGLESGLKGEIIPLARALREELATMAGYSRESLYAKPTSPHMRALLRAHGWARRIEEHEGYWVTRLLHAIAATDSDLYVTDDVRHANEAALFTRSDTFITRTPLPCDPDAYNTIDGVFPARFRLIAINRASSDPQPHEDDPPIIAEVFAAKKLAGFTVENVDGDTAELARNAMRVMFWAAQ